MAVTDDIVRTSTLLNRQMLIDGAWVPSVSGQTITVENPAKRRPIAQVPRGNAEDVDLAVRAAHRAFPAWSRTVPRERGRMLLKIADAFEARLEEIARLLALENGNALRTQARPEARNTADIFRYFGGLAGELKGETIPLRRARVELYAARADRRGRRHHSVERADPARRLEDRAGFVRRQHAGDEGGGGRAARGAADGGDLPGVPAEGRAQRVDRLRSRNAARRSPTIRWCASSRSPARPRSANR